MLDAASWSAVLAGLEQHFGVDASVDPKTLEPIRAYLASTARSKPTAADGVPLLRITETRWFRHEHDEVPGRLWKEPDAVKPADCAACHRSAARGLLLRARPAPAQEGRSEVSDRILVWDLPLRVFHWVLAASFAGAFLTAESERRARSAPALRLHVRRPRSRSGWCGASSARATRASRRCASGRAQRRRYLLSLLRGRPERHLGHSPPGAVMIPLLLGLGLAVAASGWAVYADAGGEWLEEAHEIAADGRCSSRWWVTCSASWR